MLSDRSNQGANLGFSLPEVLVTLVILTILMVVLGNIGWRLVAIARLNLAAFELSQAWKVTRFDALGGGDYPDTLCMHAVEPQQIRYAQIRGSDCQEVLHWRSLTRGVGIDRENSTLRTVKAIAGNGGDIYRVSWADTQGGMGGSWGQLGRLTLQVPGLKRKKCLFLFRVDGSWDIREDRQCHRKY